MASTEPGVILRDEAAFSDAEYSPRRNDLELSPELSKKYFDPSRFYRYEQRFGKCLGDVSGKTLLDLGCGTGQEAVFFATLGALVTAIDISPVGIDITRRRAQHHNVSVEVYNMACPTSFPDESFDIVHGVGIIHHVGLSVAMKEVKRLLKPGGTAVFCEPMGNCAPIESIKNWLRPRLLEKLKLVDVTQHETVLRHSDVLLYRKDFTSLNLHPFRLVSRIRKFFPRAFWTPMDIADHFALKLPLVGYFGGEMFIHIVK